jgi:glycosyltransferase involved in cell wall biosynthesis
MATYNGASYVTEQLASILAQLGPADEVIVVDDASSDDTVEVLESCRDPRLVVHRFAANRGYAQAFEKALILARGEHLLLADQDDVWPPGRVAVMRTALATSGVVAGNIRVLGTGRPLTGPFSQREWRLPPDASARRRLLVGLALSNVPYFGSAMGLRRDVLPLVLPYPPYARELPDAWIAITGLLNGVMTHVSEDVVLRRVHGANASGTRRSLPRVVVGRVLFVRMVREALRRRRRVGHVSEDGAARNTRL